MLNTSWEKIEWKSENAWASSLNDAKLENILSDAASTIIARTIVNRFYKQFGLTLEIFKFLGCDCTGSGQTDCFGAPVEAKLQDCSADPSAKSKCGGMTIGTETFPNGTAVSIGVKLVSGASFLGNFILF